MVPGLAPKTFLDEDQGSDEGHRVQPQQRCSIADCRESDNCHEEIATECSEHHPSEPIRKRLPDEKAHKKGKERESPPDAAAEFQDAGSMTFDERPESSCDFSRHDRR